MMDSSPPRVGIISVHYHPPYASRTLDVLTRRMQQFRPLEVVLVANNDEVHAALHKAAPAATLLQHDNAGMEFGGYQAGMDRLLERHDLDWIVLLNDTVANTDNYSPQYHQQFIAALAHRLPVPTIVGRVDAISRSYALDGMRTHRWVRTNLFALNRPALEALNHRVYHPEVDALIKPASTVGGFFDADLDPVLLDHLEIFLFHSRPGWHWYAGAPLTAQNADRMARKARSIVQEKFLAAKLDHCAADFSNIKEMPLKQKTLRKLDDIRFDWMKKRR